MIILHLNNGLTKRLDLSRNDDLYSLDSIKYQKTIRRVSFIDENGKRTDLPFIKERPCFMWIEIVKLGDEIRGERFYMRTNKMLFKATLYYSDKRVVIDIDSSGGFR